MLYDDDPHPPGARPNKLALLALLITSGIALLMAIVLFGNMLPSGCLMNSVHFLYWFLGSFGCALAATLCQRRPALGLMLAALVLLLAGSGIFLHAFAHNQVVDCGFDTDSTNGSYTI